MQKKNCFITTFDGEWAGPVDVLHNQLGFEVVKLHAKPYGNFPTRKQLLKKELDYSLKLLFNIKKYNNSGIIICSNYCALALLLFSKLHLLKCDKIIWYGVYLHNPKMFDIVRKYIKFAMPKHTEFKIVVFSRPEVKLYTDAFALAEEHFLYMPYGEWNPDKKLLETKDLGYFFSGGYANRDFVTLAKLFQDKPWKLVIAASKANEDFAEYVAKTEISDNISVYWDIPAEQFNELLRYSHGMILLMKYNTGASGQILLLTALEYSKLIVASYTDVIDEYVKDMEQGLILEDKSEENLQKVMDYIFDENNAEQLETLARAGHKHYEDTFSYKAISDYLVDVMRQEMA